MFKQELKSLTGKIPGAVGAILMGLDGISVEKYVIDKKINLEAFSAEYLSLVKRTFETNRELGVGRVDELTVFAENLTALIKAVTPEYFIVCALTAGSIAGRARYEMKKSTLRLAKELV